MNFNILDLYIELDLLTSEMLKTLKINDDEGEWINKITGLLDKRQVLMDNISNGDSSLKNSPDNAKIEQLIKRIYENNKLITEQFSERMLAMQEKIGQVKQNKVAQDAYLGIDEPSDAWFFDSKK